MLKHGNKSPSSLVDGDEDSDSGSSSSCGEGEVDKRSIMEVEEARRVWEQHTVPKKKHHEKCAEVDKDIEKWVARNQDTDKWVGVGQDTSGVVLGEVKAVAGLGRGQQMQLKLFLGLVLLLGLVLYSILLHFALQASRCPV